MNLEKTIHAFFNRNILDKQPENEYKPRAKNIVCVERTVYPNGKPQFSKHGSGEWYGESEVKQLNIEL